MLADGVAGEPGVAEPDAPEPGVPEPLVEACPALPELPAGAVPPAGALCAVTQLAQPNTTDKTMSFRVDIFAASPAF